MSFTTGEMPTALLPNQNLQGVKRKPQLSSQSLITCEHFGLATDFTSYGEARAP